MFLRVLSCLIAYRFAPYVNKKRFELPPRTPESLKGKDGAREIREKARASSALAGVFVGFGAAFLAALISLEHLDSALDPLRSPESRIFVVLGVVLPYLIFRQERRISAASVEARGKEHDYFLLVVWFVGLIATLLPIFFHPSAGLGPALSLSGFFLIVFSLLLLVLSVEFYDSAAGWQAGDDEVYHFHMASIVSHCYLMGLSLGMVGIPFLLCRTHPRMGCSIAATVLIFLIAMTETGREVHGFHLARELRR
jgi:hypothetical protein